MNATYSGKTEETIIEWVLEDDGDLDIRQIYIEWIENNITNFTSKPQIFQIKIKKNEFHQLKIPKKNFEFF